MNFRKEHWTPKAKRCLTAVVASAALWSWAGIAAAQPLSPGSQQELDPALTTYQPTNGLSGRVSIAGSDTMKPLMNKLASQFMHMHQGTKFAVASGGSSQAIREFVLGISYQRRGDKVRGKGTDGASTADLLASSRPMTEKERKAFASHHGYEPVEVPIARDAVAIYVNNENPINGLTLDQLDGIFSASHKRKGAPSIETWGQLGLSGEWANQPIHLYGRDENSGTHDFFKHVALLDGDIKEDVQEQPGSASEILAIAQDRLAIGYAGSGYQTSLVKVVPLAEQAGGRFVLPSAESVTNGTYPMARPLYLYVNKGPKNKMNPIVAEFLNFVNTRQGQETVARANYYPLTNMQVARNRQVLELENAVASTETGSDDVRVAEQTGR